jgi:hypothetical protein
LPSLKICDSLAKVDEVCQVPSFLFRIILIENVVILDTYYDIYYYFGGCDYFVTYKSAIKVTVDGPRPKRLTKGNL